MDPAPGVLPVGRACEGFEILILDEAGCEVPAGEVGEITVRSDYLPPGYWRDPELTAAKFLDRPLPEEPGRAYWVKVSAREDGTFTVTNSRNGFSKEYR